MRSGFRRPFIQESFNFHFCPHTRTTIVRLIWYRNLHTPSGTSTLQTERVLAILLLAAHAVGGAGGLVADGLARVAEALGRAADGVAHALAESADGVADGVGLVWWMDGLDMRERERGGNWWAG